MNGERRALARHTFVGSTEYSLKVTIYLLVLVVARMAVQVILIGLGSSDLHPKRLLA